MTPLHESPPDPAAWQSPDFLWHHAAFCRMALPARAPSGAFWSRETAQGGLAMGQEGEAGDEAVPLPAGRGLRLLLLHVFSAALRAGTATAPLGNGIEAVCAALGLEPSPARLRELREQLMRLIGARLRVAEGRQAPLPVLDARSTRGWTDPSEWRQALRLNERFLASLRQGAVPLHRAAVAALQDSAAALDAYAWLAATLPGLPADRPLPLRWEALRQPFGQGSQSPAAFRTALTDALAAAVTAYPGARVEVGEEGVTLWHGPPPAAPGVAGAAAPASAPPPAPGPVPAAAPAPPAASQVAPAAPSALPPVPEPAALVPPAAPQTAPAAPSAAGPEPAVPPAPDSRPTPPPARPDLPRPVAAPAVATAAMERPAPVPPAARGPAPMPERHPVPAPAAVMPSPAASRPPAREAVARPARWPDPSRPPRPPAQEPRPDAPGPAARRPEGGRSAARTPDRIRLPPSVTGLPQAIWLKRGEARESMTIEVTPGAEYDPARRSLLAIEPIVLQVFGTLVPRELERIAAWVTTNAGVIQDYWDWSIDSGDEVMEQVRRVPTSRW